MKFFVVLSLFALMGLSACSKGPVKEVDDFVAAKDEIMSAWAKEMDANPTEAGVDNMRKIFESKKSELIAKKEAVLKISESLHGDSWGKLSDSQSMDRQMGSAMAAKVSSAPSVVGEKIRALLKDYEAAVKIPNLI